MCLNDCGSVIWTKQRLQLRDAGPGPQGLLSLALRKRDNELISAKRVL